METIATLTLNPTIDASFAVEAVTATHKIRTQSEWYVPGGGGITVARMLKRLGTDATCIYAAGGATGAALDLLIADHGLSGLRIPIAGPVRIAANIFEAKTECDYRFTPAGPRLTEQEWQLCLDTLARRKCDLIALSGSLPPGVPDDFYAQAAERLRPLGTRVVLDASGRALSCALEVGGLLLVKPALSELASQAGRSLDGPTQIARAALELVSAGKTDFVAVTMGRQGALLAHEGGAVLLPALKVKSKGAVGAGDSLVAGMIHALSRGNLPEDAFRFGVASASATVRNSGTQLADLTEVMGLLKTVGKPQRI